MAACRKKKGDYKCTLEKDHVGPQHIDERTNTSWVDDSLQEPELVPVDEMANPPLSEGVL